jgi:D-3-phosphoglycerate dehydrogenase
MLVKIVIADSMEPEVIAEISKLGQTAVTPSDLQAALADADALIVRSATKVTEELLSHAPRLKLVARAGVGLDNVDAEACKKRGIKVVNTPGAPTNSVSELALCMMFAIARKISKADESMKNKAWLKKELVGTELMDKTLGIVGLGRIGASLAIKANAIGMRVLYYDPRQEGAAVGKKVSLDEIFASSDYISLHVPLVPETKMLVNAAAIAKMKSTAVIVNTARGGLVDEDALYLALREKKIKGAALDVYPQEPYNGKLCELDNVVLTPHIGGSTKEAQARIGQELVAKLREELG